MIALKFTVGWWLRRAVKSDLIPCTSMALQVQISLHGFRSAHLWHSQVFVWMRGIPGLHYGQGLTSSCISPVSGFIRTFRLYYRQDKIRNSVARKPLFKACILTLFFAVGSEQAAQQSLRSFQVARDTTIFWNGKPRYLIDAVDFADKLSAPSLSFLVYAENGDSRMLCNVYSVLPHYTALYIRSVASSLGYTLIISKVLVAMNERASPSSRVTLKC